MIQSHRNDANARLFLKRPNKEHTARQHAVLWKTLLSRWCPAVKPIAIPGDAEADAGKETLSDLAGSSILPDVGAAPTLRSYSFTRKRRACCCGSDPSTRAALSSRPTRLALRSLLTRRAAATPLSRGVTSAALPYSSTHHSAPPLPPRWAN